MLALTGPCTVSTISYITNQAFYLCLKMVKSQPLEAYVLIT